MNPSTRRRAFFLVGFALYFGTLWLLWDTMAVYPLKIFVVLLHELSHGLAAVLTGGGIERIVLDPGQGGACHCPGGNPFVTLSAGYLGSVVWGAVLLEAARTLPHRTPLVTGGIGFLVATLSLLYVRSLFGLLFGVVFGIALLASARWLSRNVNRVILRVLGLTSCLYAILDIKSDVLDRPHLPSDAAMLSRLTGIPTVFWGLLWIGIAVGVAVWLFRRAYRSA